MTRYRERRESGMYAPPKGDRPTAAAPVETVADLPPPAAEEVPDLDQLNKTDLLAYAQQLGVSPAHNAMTKAEIREGVDAKLAGGG